MSTLPIPSAPSPAGIQLAGAPVEFAAKAPQASDLREAAEAFEAIFVRQLLASARAADFGGEALLGGPGIEQFEAMRDEHFAKVTSAQGVFGLAEAIERQLSAFATPAEE